MTMSICPYEPPSREYNVNFLEDNIFCTFTSTGTGVCQWLSSIQNIHDHRLNNFIVGLDIEWRPNFGRGIDNPVAILQFCVSRRCLPSISHYFPQRPEQHLRWVGISTDVNNLIRDYGLSMFAGRISKAAQSGASESWVENAGDSPFPIISLPCSLPPPPNSPFSPILTVISLTVIVGYLLNQNHRT
ncbi:hypothetical protein NE237_029970 [Protea cynaroides]|uniref:Uncharacterized protein n=1 Tax=Protea cynaroides TaxID=273540 RepID=A0A9Q0GUX3_9MAGN|nr:hypothetical protein NE237_029970 [Protea cynaroides]